MIIFIVGPTAVGKSQIALDLARQINGEIVCCDAMQIYQEITIASDKPDQKMRELIPHHLFDIVSIQEPFNVFMYFKKAQEIILNILSSHKIPIICGGSGMYMSALLDGIFETDKIDPKIRQQLEQQAKIDLKTLYLKLQQVDLEAAKRIKENDSQRIIRALEVFEGLGRPISVLQKERKGLWGAYEMHLFGLERPREILYARAEERIEQMFQQGLVEEIKIILNKTLTSTASKLIGIPEVSGFLKGEYDLDRAKYLMKLNTRHYVKRQLTWFKRDERIQWIDIDEHQTAYQIAQRIKNKIEKIKE